MRLTFIRHDCDWHCRTRKTDKQTEVEEEGGWRVQPPRAEATSRCWWSEKERCRKPRQRSHHILYPQGRKTEGGNIIFLYWPRIPTLSKVLPYHHVRSLHIAESFMGTGSASKVRGKLGDAPLTHSNHRSQLGFDSWNPFKTLVCPVVH